MPLSFYAHAATLDDGDFSLLSMPLTFASGSSDGEGVCASVIAYSDNLVESEEFFVVRLILITPGESFFSLENTETAINLIDSDCM